MSSRPLETRVDGGFGVYVHWPFCASKCPYCDFNSHVRERIDERRWRQAFIRELTSVAERLPARPTVETVFFGGGTPSLMAGETVGAILEAIAALFSCADDLEVTLEANPSSADAARFRDYRAAGVNRVSLGVQSLDDEVLAFLGRRHTAREAEDAIALARAEFPRLSFDLITARPGQTLGAWGDELGRAIRLAADHLSIYQLTFEPGTKFETLRAAGHIAPLRAEAAADIFAFTEEVTRAAGLEPYEISNHALPGAESRHNLVYWRGGAWLGIGPGAHGRLPDGALRLASETHLAPERWLSAVEKDGHGHSSVRALSERDHALEVLIMGLRLAEGVSLARLGRLSGDLIDQDRLAALTAEGYLSTDDERLKLTAKGRPLLDRLLVEITR